MPLSSSCPFRQSAPAPSDVPPFPCASAAETIGFTSPFRASGSPQTSSPSFSADYPALHCPYAAKQPSIISTTLCSCVADPSNFRSVWTCSRSTPLSCSLPPPPPQVSAPSMQLGSLSHVTPQGLAMGCCVGVVWAAVSEERAWPNPNFLNV